MTAKAKSSIDEVFDCQAALISVNALVDHCNPFPNTPWGCKIDPQEVLLAVEQEQFLSEPWEKFRRPTKIHHIKRIAYLVKHGWEDAIEIDVGCPCLGYYENWFVIDGNHRFCAAIVRQQELILASVAGQISHAEELFGIKFAR